jgi:hypothetical protein
MVSAVVSRCSVTIVYFLMRLLVAKTSPVHFDHVTSQHRLAAIRISYKNAADAPTDAELHVNRQVMTRIAFPSIGVGVRLV